MEQNYSKYVACETTFKIPNVLYRTTSGSFMEQISTEFYVRSSGSMWWRLTVDLGPQKLRGYLANTRNTFPLDAWYSVSIIDVDGLKRSVCPLKTHTFTDNQGIEISPFVNPQQLRDDPKLLRTGGELWLHCEVFSNPFVATATDSLEFRVPLAVDKGRGFEMSFHPQHKKFSDVVVAVGDKVIKAHKVILSMCSPMFSAMFESEMLEQKQNRVVISDMDYEVVQEMLRYIYTGKTPRLHVMADRLLMAAEKYSLDGLKLKCEQRLSETISMKTVIELMSLADLHNAKLLKTKLNEFITTNFPQLMKNSSWQKLLYAGSYKVLPSNGSPNKI